MNIPVKISKSIPPTVPCWTISPNLIQLEDDLDTVSWDLSDLQATYKNSNTLFEIEFQSCPGPNPLNTALGPFSSLDLKGGYFEGQLRNHDWGAYVYNLYVKEPNKDRQKITVDPQIDNVAPPGTPVP